MLRKELPLRGGEEFAVAREKIKRIDFVFRKPSDIGDLFIRPASFQQALSFFYEVCFKAYDVRQKFAPIFLFPCEVLRCADFLRD